MNKTCLAVAVLIFTAANAAFAGGEIMLKKIVLNGKTKAVSIAAHKEEGALFLEAQSLAQALGFSLKRQSNLAILCTETACLPYTIGEKEAREKDGQLFISPRKPFSPALAALGNLMKRPARWPSISPTNCPRTTRRLT